MRKTAPLREPFFTALAAQELSEIDTAIALLWFFTHDAEANELSAKELAEHMVESRLRGTINISRLAARLKSHPDIVRGRSPGTFRVRASSEAKLGDRFESFRRADNLPVQDRLLPASISLGARNHLERLRREINGCYQYGLYNGCAVMCRRLMEILLIESFDKKGGIDEILDSKGNLRTLNEILSIQKSQKILRLSRGAAGLMDRVKETGDAAAHSRYYVASKQDIDDLNPAFRHVVAELASLAGLA